MNEEEGNQSINYNFPVDHDNDPNRALDSSSQDEVFDDTNSDLHSTIPSVLQQSS